MRWKGNTKRRKSKWVWNNNHDLTWLFLVITNGYCHVRRLYVLVTEPVHISILKIMNAFHLHRCFFIHYWPARGELSLENAILEYSIPKSQPAEDSVFKNIRIRTDHRGLTADDTILDDIAFRPTFLKMAKFSRESIGHSQHKHCWQNVVFWKVCKICLAKMLSLLAIRQTKICKGSDAVTDKSIPVIIVYYQSIVCIVELTLASEHSLESHNVNILKQYFSPFCIFCYGFCLALKENKYIGVFFRRLTH